MNGELQTRRVMMTIDFLSILLRGLQDLNGTPRLFRVLSDPMPRDAEIVGISIEPPILTLKVSSRLWPDPGEDARPPVIQLVEIDPALIPERKKS